MNNGNHSINNGNEDHDLNIIPVIRFTDIMSVVIRPYPVVFSMWFLIETEELLVGPNDSLAKVGWLLQNLLTKLLSLCFVDISKGLNRSVTIETEMKFMSENPPHGSFSG